jgi:hypothetical protein
MNCQVVKVTRNLRMALRSGVSRRAVMTRTHLISICSPPETSACQNAFGFFGVCGGEISMAVKAMHVGACADDLPGALF